MAATVATNTDRASDNFDVMEQAARAIRHLISAAEKQNTSGSVAVRVTVVRGRAKTVRRIYEMDE